MTVPAALARQAVLGAIRRSSTPDPYDEICTWVGHIRGIRVLVWTRMPDGMTAHDLGRRFFGPAVEMGPDPQ